MQATRRGVLALLATALAVTGLAGVAPAVTGPAVPAVGQRPAFASARSGVPAWHPCPEDTAVQCGTLRVPVDWDAPYGPSVDLALARRRATDPGARVGALIVNPGGPGGSGVDFALGADRFFSAALRSRFDIVGFDPRGVARSNPVRCSAALVAAAPSPLLRGPSEFAAAVAYNRRLAADCRAHTGALFGHVDTASVVRDIDALRAALGEPRLTFYGASYGTLMGQQYAERYPDRVRAIVLDSTVDHSGDTTDFLGAETDAVQDSFAQFVAWCAGDESCVLRGRDVPALWQILLAQARRGALRDPVHPGRRLSVLELVDVAFTSFYGPQWYALAYFLDAAAAGTPAKAAAGPAAAMAGRVAAVRPPVGRAGTAGLVEDSFPAIFCEDWSLPLADYPAYAEALRRSARRAPQILISPLALSATVGCLGWPSRPDNPQPSRQRVHPMPNAASLLLINARHDPATPMRWARAVAARSGPGASLVRYDGWGHVVYGRTRCVTEIVDRYLTDLRKPPVGTRCAGVLPDPFGVGRRPADPRRRPVLPGPGGWSAPPASAVHAG